MTNTQSVKKITTAFFFVFLFCFGFISSTFANSENITTLEFQYCENNVCTDIKNSRLEKKFEVGEKISLRIVIKNPENAPVFSVQSWLKFNSSVLSLSGLNDEESAFDLAAPGEFKVINSKGEVRIGRATTGSSLTDSEIIVADFDVEIKKNPNLTTLQFLDFKKDSIGKTAVVTIHGNIPANIVETQPKNLVFKNLKSSAVMVTSKNTQEEKSVNIAINSGNNMGSNNTLQNRNQNVDIAVDNTSVHTSNSVNSVENNEDTVTFLSQPTGFRTRTFENGEIQMIWELNQDPKVKGYYLYYSTTSGTYMHRRDMGKTNTYTFDKNFFKKDRKIFFAVQAYSANGTVSDFSNETSVITGNAGSSSHPFFEQIFPNAEKIGEDIEKNKAYYADVTQNSVQKNTVITGNRNIQSGINIQIVLLLLGGVMIFLSGMYVIFARKEV